ncbi:MAG: LptA/OstA family protein [Acetobacteraceae bacterium]
MNRLWALRLALVAALSGAGVVPAAAQGIDLSHGGPIAITSRDGIEWLQQQHEVIAMGDARAVRGNVTVTADRLIAFYRKKADAPGTTPTPAATLPTATPPTAASPAANTGSPLDTTGTDEGSNEIYRLEARGNVVIVTPTDRAQGDNAVYDLDQAVMVMTGGALRLTTPNDVLTARDDLEYWSAKHMAVARGDAVVITKDNRRITADVLVAYTTPDNAPPAGTPTKVSASANNDDPLGAGKLQKVDAFGHVVVSTPTDVVTGDRGVYVPDTGIAVLVDHVRITRGQNQLEGSEAQVNLKSGVSRLLATRQGRGADGRVQGLLVPNEAPGALPGDTPGNAVAKPTGTAVAKPKGAKQ